LKASILDLRYRMKDVLRAVDRGETVTVTHRGKEKARIVPAGKPDKQAAKPSSHPACGMWKDREDIADPEEWVRKVREPRFRDLFKK